MLTREVPGAMTTNGAHPRDPGTGKLVSVCVLTAQPVVRAGLTTMLDSADVGVRVHEDPCSGHPDILLFDVALLDDESRAAEHTLASSTATVIAVDSLSRPDLTSRARSAGIEWGITLGVTCAELRDVVHGAVAGTLADSVIATRWRIASFPGEDCGLSRREAEVLRLIASGLPNLVIAEQLSVSINSVKSYVRAAYRKIGVTSRSQAVAWAMRRGLGSSCAGPDSPPDSKAVALVPRSWVL